MPKGGISRHRSLSADQLPSGLTSNKTDCSLDQGGKRIGSVNGCSSGGFKFYLLPPLFAKEKTNDAGGAGLRALPAGCQAALVRAPGARLEMPRSRARQPRD